jgi:hypothetical protein
MTSLRSCACTASMACLMMAAGLKAGENHPGHNPTYFGRPGSGPSGPVYKYQHPSTYSWFGHRHSKDAASEQEKIDREYRIAMGQHVASLNRLTERREQAYLWAHPNSAVVPLGHANANYGQGFGQAERDHQMWHLFHGGLRGGGDGHGHKHGDGKGCAECEKFAKNKCPKCGKGGFGDHGCPGCGHGVGGGHGLGGHGFGKHGGWGGAPLGNGAGAGGPPYYSAYPGMNREDALRYIEGFQYYPPYHLLRSPREFFMWDVKYGLGK